MRSLGLAPSCESHTYSLDGNLHTVLVQLAEREQRLPEEVHADLLADALAQRGDHERLWWLWESLSPREQDVTALTCLGYTNRQMAARLHVSPDTVKGYVRQALVRYNLHGKNELRLLLADWDFSAWGPPAQS
ncbi:MAG: LuxR family transcriptional regulator [Anaerolineales bacterium]|nr:LuxR family transcriptional regulator [Anaerolineales bacterium]